MHTSSALPHSKRCLPSCTILKLKLARLHTGHSSLVPHAYGMQNEHCILFTDVHVCVKQPGIPDFEKGLMSIC